MANSTATRWLLSLISAAVVVAVSISKQVSAQPQINLLNRGCSQYNAINTRNFFDNLNATFSDLRNQLSSQNKRFATAQQLRSSDPVYAMVQCRNYLSTADCVACYDAAVAQIRNCSAANGARVIYDGCFLRYESNSFYDQTTLPGNVQICSNRTASQAAAFNAAASTFLQNLELATPRINGYFAATKSEMEGLLMPPVLLGTRIRHFFADNQTINITPFLGGGGGSSKKKAIIGGVVGGAGLVLIIAALFLWYHLSRKPKVAARGNILWATELQGPTTYNYKDLKSATSNFSEENKLGEGGFGDVYKATLKNGNVIAVKKLDISISRAKADFESEVRLISNVHHRNLVRLLGCCNKGGELLLVYEFMPNGSLDNYLYGEKRGTLNWKQRFNIIFGTARGLAYLHDQYHVCIIHRDIKPSNILLDDDFLPKIADFGLARLLPENQSHVSTKFAGTLGYTAPEYAIHGHLSEKVDAYSFGIVILEIISGRRCTQMNDESDTEYLLEEAWKLHETGMQEKLVDETLDRNDFKAEDVKKLIEIALACAQSPASSRPTMSEVLVMLSSDRSVEQKTPSRPSFFDTGKRLTDSSISTGSSASNATASVTHFTGR
ncbi:Cysteine-rich receptor-like protein kinase 2 [Forsythia ovata]|uniref:Cysteine-rich receptor-like protein kinase 2 n=1 Tax=Forsythia ovata TaxID=205694 RepID=A0ABD1UA54_9LAMI